MGSVLVATIFLPVLGAILADEPAARARRVALATVVATLALAAVLVAWYPAGALEYAVWEFPWLGGPTASVDIRFSVGLDGLGLWFFALTALLMLVSVLVSWQAIAEKEVTYYRLLLLLETGLLGVFTARDIILFYVFFEFTLIPLYFLIGVWGSQQRRYAAIKFFLFTLAGSVLTFLGLLALVLWDYAHSAAGRMTFSIAELTDHLGWHRQQGQFGLTVQTWLFLALFAGFAIKVPLVPLHTWLPLAHVEAPTAGSVLLAGVLLKVGSYGFVRFSLPMLPDATAAAMPWLLALSVIGIVYGALVALAQEDIKRLIAYSSVSHLGFCMLGVFALNPLGLYGGVLQMVNHGLSTGGLFAVVGMLYERYHTRQIRQFGGLARKLPVLATFTMILTLSSIGLPGTNGFAGEFLLLLGMFSRALGSVPLMVVAVAATSGVVLGAWYMLDLVGRVFFGPVREPGDHATPLDPAPKAQPVSDLSAREIAALVPLVLPIFWIGLQPGFFLDRMRPALDRIEAAVRIQPASHMSNDAHRMSNPLGQDRDQRPTRTAHASGLPGLGRRARGEAQRVITPIGARDPAVREAAGPVAAMAIHGRASRGGHCRD